jgi:hypothetical protein
MIEDGEPHDPRRASSRVTSNRWNGPRSNAARQRRLRRSAAETPRVLELLHALRNGSLPADSPDSLP